jgi:predicted permease
LFVRERADREFSSELHAHLALAEEELERHGMSAKEARRQARVKLGGVEQTRELHREASVLGWVETIWQDVRLALRTVRKNPGFSAVAILTLALGIGANTAIFTLIQQVMLRTLPVAKPEQLWRFGDVDRCCFSDGYIQGHDDSLPPNDWNFFSWEAYKNFRANTPAFDDLAAFQIGGNNAELAVRRADSAEAVTTGNGEYVSGNFFQTFGISAWRGRLFTDADDQEGQPPVAVMSFRAWQSKYGSDPSVVGATYQMNGHAFTVIGISQPGFLGAKIADSGMPDFWLPLSTEPLIAGPTSRLKNPRLAWLDLIGRVRPGTNPKTLEAQLQVELHQWLASHSADMTPLEKSLFGNQTLHLTPGGAGVSLLRNTYEKGLRLLMIAALCVLLVACANIASLLLARALKDRPQTALRAALGASRSRLTRKALAESLTLSFFGCVAGIAVAYAGAKLILSLAFTSPDGAPVNAVPSAPVLLFAVAISIVTGIVFGSAPAWMSSHADPIDALHGASRSVGLKRGVFARAQKTLVIVQAAASLVLLSAAAMLGQSLRNLEHQNFGFDTAGRYLVSVDPKISNYQPDQLAPRFREIEDQLRSIPGVRSVGAILEAPQIGWVPAHAIRVQGKPEPGDNQDVSSSWTRVTPGFFDALGDKIIAGRDISEADNANTQPVAVVNESFVKRFFADENPIGRHFGPVPRKNAGMYEIVGVASDVSFGDSFEPVYFLPEAQTTHLDDPEAQEREVWSHYLYDILIWAPGNPSGLELQAKQAVANIDPNLMVSDVRRYSDMIRFPQQLMIASVTWLFGAIGLVLAAVGLYGVTAYGVEQRTSEIGVRMALGANRVSILRMVIAEGLGLALAGIIFGIVGAIALASVLRSQLFGIAPTDPVTFAGVAIALAVVAVAACYVPARRAMRIDPATAMRTE